MNEFETLLNSVEDVKVRDVVKGEILTIEKTGKQQLLSLVQVLKVSLHFAKSQTTVMLISIHS